MAYGCASSHFTLITIRPIDELFMSDRAMRSGEIDPAVGVKQQDHWAAMLQIQASLILLSTDAQLHVIHFLAQGHFCYRHITNLNIIIFNYLPIL